MKTSRPEAASLDTVASVQRVPGRAKQFFWPCLAIILILALTALQLHHQGRPWWCACGQWFLWSGDVQSMHNSQHLLDPYSFTHILHGLVIAGILTWLAPRVPWPWGVVLAVLVEALWELIENSPFIIERYRSTTASLGYTGDSVGNSLGDILSGACGYILARWLGGTSGGAPWASSRLLQPQRLLSCGASPRASAPLCRFTSPPAHACVV